MLVDENISSFVWVLETVSRIRTRKLEYSALYAYQQDMMRNYAAVMRSSAA
jgi:hypothetical protein